jgi:hypothetical protein
VITIWQSTSIHRVEGKRMKGKNNSETHQVTKRNTSSSKIFTGNTEFPDRLSAKDGKVYYINSKEKKLQREG